MCRVFDAVLQTLMSSLHRNATGHLNHLASVVLAAGVMQHPLDETLVDPLVEVFCRDSTAGNKWEVSC